MSSALISDSQKEFIISSIKNDFRVDGRANSQPQKYVLKINNLDHLLGSSLLNVQSSPSQVHIYTGIKLKVQKQSNSSGILNTRAIRQRVVLELGCIKKLTETQEQTRVYIEQYLNKYIVENYLTDFQQLLQIPKAKRYYLTINIETYILSTPHVSYLEHLYLSVKTALQNIEMPQFTVAFNEVTDEEVVEVTLTEKDGAHSQKQSNATQSISPYKGLHEIKVIGVLGQNYVQGMTVDEYEAVESSVLIAFDQEKKVVSFQSLKGTLKVQEIHQIIKFARN